MNIVEMIGTEVITLIIQTDIFAVCERTGWYVK